MSRALDDARALCADQALPDQVTARVVPGLCRLALEAAMAEAVWRRALRAGRSHAEVEADLEAADSLTKRAALALFGQADRGGEVLPRLNAWGRRAADTYQALNRGAHHGHGGDLPGVVADTDWLVTKVRANLP